jgi:outer membrane receptor protein involved in Fe transport
MGTENQWNEFQWVDVTAPWVGAPIKLNDSTSTESISIGSSNDIWKARPRELGAFVEDRITYKGLQATLGLRMNMWAPGTFADQAIADPNSPVVDAVRADYLDKTIGMAGLRWKARLLPRLDVTFPVTPNHVLYFNYGHSMRLPHPRFTYAGLDPIYQDRSFLSFLGNPNLDPEVNVAYEVGYKAAFSRSFGATFGAYNSNRFDYIVSRRVFVTDATGRPVTKTMYINQDYARIQGVELGIEWQLNPWTRWVANASLQSARGKSNSARESALQIEQTGEVPLSREQFLAWDRPWNINSSWFFQADTSLRIAGISLRGLGGFLQYRGSAGYRYTPQELVGTNDLGRPQYAIKVNEFLTEVGATWHSWDARLTYDLASKKGRGIQFSLEVLNVLNRLNSQLINPVTGRAYQYGDDVPNTWRDPRPEFNGPQERGLDPRDPSRFSPPRQILFGLQFKL